jgi:hypothetical protein
MTFGRTRVIACVVAFASLAQAAPDANDLSTARSLYREGVELAQRGDHRGAANKLSAARDLVRTPIILLALAKSHAAIGQLVEAQEAALDAGRIPRQAAETPKSDEARTEAAELAKNLDARIPRLRVLATKGAIVTVDGTKLHDSSLGELRLMNPGTHRVDVEGSVQNVDLSEGARRELDLRRPEKAVSSSPKLPARTKEKPKAAFYTVRKESPLVPIGFTVGAVALLSGAVAGLGAIAKETTLDCPSNQCPPSQWNALDSARVWGNVTTGMFIVAGVGFVTGITGLVLTKQVTVQKRGFSAYPWASPAGAGMGVQTRFE